MCVAYMIGLHLDTNWSEGNVHCVWACVCGVCVGVVCVAYMLFASDTNCSEGNVHCVWCVCGIHDSYMIASVHLDTKCTACGST